jgi:hypothetical protein
VARDFSNSDNVIDSRDIIARIEELQDERSSLQEDVEEASDRVKDLEDGDDSTEADEHLAQTEASLQEWDEENGEELKTLLALQDECNWGDWSYGTTLIRDSYFQDYAQEFAEDIGAINSAAGWPNNCIDWEQATRELQMDYTSVEFDGVTYWLRS